MFAPLRTTRLVIEPLDERDVAAFTAYRRIPDVARWQSWNTDYSEAAARVLVAGQPSGGLPDAGCWLQLAVRDVDSTTLLGDLALHRLADQPATFEIGVTLAPESQGRGLATEALHSLIEHLFVAEGAHRVIASCDARNTPVARLLKRVGMRHESHQIDADFFKGEWTTLDGYAILESEPRTSGLNA